MDLFFGKKARDKITGFEGIITGKCEFLYGCNQYGITPPAKESETKSTQWFDDGRIEIIGEGVTPESVKTEKNGGDSSDAPVCY
jgi:hypothetical protein